MPITVTEPGPDGTLLTVAEPPPDAAPSPAESGDPGASAPPPVEPAAPEPAAPAPSESAPESPQTPDTTTEDDEDDAPEMSRKARQAFARMRREKEEARREAAASAARAQLLEQGYQRPPQAPEPVPLHQQPEPREEDYASQQEWFSAVRAWDKAQLKQELAREAYQQQVQQRQAEQRRQLGEQAEAARQKYADFDQVLDRLQAIPTLPALDACVHASPLGAEIAYYLAKHPEELARLNALTVEAPMAMAMEVGQIAAQLRAPTNGTSSPSRPPSPPLPPPVTPLQGTGSPGQADPNFDDMSQKEFENWWRRTYPGQR